MMLFLAALVLAQEPAFRADISLVEIDAVAIAKGGVVEGLGRSDFAVKDNRKPVTLRHVTQEQTPLDVVLVFETSKLMGKRLGQLTVASERQWRKSAKAIASRLCRSTKTRMSSCRSRTI